MHRTEKVHKTLVLEKKDADAIGRVAQNLGSTQSQVLRLAITTFLERNQQLLHMEA